MRVRLKGLRSFRSSHNRCSVEKIFLKILQYSQEKTCVESLFSKVSSLQVVTGLQKKIFQETIFDNWNPFKNDDKCFLFHLKRYLNFCLNFLDIKENGSIRKITLISKFMTSQAGKQTITMHILPNISRSNEIWFLHKMWPRN